MSPSFDSQAEVKTVRQAVSCLFFIFKAALLFSLAVLRPEVILLPLPSKR